MPFQHTKSKKIQKTILGAFGCVIEYRKQFSKALLIPVTVLVLLGSIPVSISGLSLLIFYKILAFLAYVFLAIITHRIILLGPGAVPEWGLSAAGKREIYFIGYSLGIGLSVTLINYFGLASPTIWLISIIAMIYILARVSLVFPAVATDSYWTFFDSWKATRGHQTLMLVVVLIFPIVIGIPEMLLSRVPHMGIIVNVLSVVTMVFVVAALSVAFRVVTKESAGI
jgi:hypothetical protein